MGQRLDLGVIVGADHDGIDHPAQHAGGVGDALAPADLHPARFHDDGAAAQLTHRHVEGNARAGRVLLEDHRQHMAGQRRIGIGLALGPTDARDLTRLRVGKDRPQRVASRIGQIEKMPGHYTASSRAKLAAPAESFSINSSICASSITSGGTIRTV